MLHPPELFIRDLMSADFTFSLANKIFFVTMLPTVRLHKPTSISDFEICRI
jgi:hypothetical protein